MVNCLDNSVVNIIIHTLLTRNLQMPNFMWLSKKLSLTSFMHPFLPSSIH